MDMPLAADLKPTLLVVDDTPVNLSIMSSLLKGHYRVKIARDGEKALEIADGATRPDLILLDVSMPGMDGYEVCRRLKASPGTRDIPVIFLTARASADDEQHGLELGAVDYITKPISQPIVLARVRTHLQLKSSADFLRDQNAFLESEVARRTEQVRAVQDVTILALASLAETRDNETGNHIRRTQHYVRTLAETLQRRPRYAPALSDHNIALLFKSAPLHDIGKVGIPDAILLKPGRYTPEEFEVMKAHPRLGRDAIDQAARELGGAADFLVFAKEIAYSHHEKWDGSGYPERLAGDAIPVSGRLMAIADVYDALISRRVYKEGMSHEKALGIIVEGRGTHFDPEMLDAMLAIEHEFRAIAQRYADA